MVFVGGGSSQSWSCCGKGVVLSFVGEEYMAEKSRLMVWVNVRAGFWVLSSCEMEIVYDGVGVSTLATDWMVIESPLRAGIGCWRRIIGLGHVVLAMVSSPWEEKDGPFGFPKREERCPRRAGRQSSPKSAVM